MRQGNDNMDNQTVIWVVLALIIMFAVPAFYAARAGYINDILLTLSLAQITPFDGLPEVKIAQAHIDKLDPAALTWEQMEGVLRYSGKWIRWPWLVILIMLGIVAILLNKTNGLVRRFNMDTLLRNNAESFACLNPIVGRGTYLLSPESFDSGLWRVARTPLQFAHEHELLLAADGNPVPQNKVLKNGLAVIGSDVFGQLHLDEAKALKVLQDQLGPVFSGFENLSSCRRAAAAAFLAYANGDKKDCIAILDAVSSSYTEDKGIASSAVLDQPVFVEKLEKSWKKASDVLADGIFQRHSAFELPWFMALLTRVRQKGVLASSQFLWLRPLDRPLWYALNQCGGRAAWAEGFAPWAHYMAEEKAGMALSKPQLAQAVVSLRNALDAQGWLADVPSSKRDPAASPESEKKTPQTVQEASPRKYHAYRAAELDPKYDANNDPELLAEHI